MLVSRRWLKEIIVDLNLSDQAIALRLAQIGLAVDAVKPVGQGLEHVVVAEVRQVEPHPDRERLKLVSVDVGSETLRIVCGASNVPGPGGKVVLARVGAKLPGFSEPLAARKVGGVLSPGMLTSLAELGIAESSDGIWVLDEKQVAGMPLLEAMPFLSDTLFDLDITPNRGDALGHLGVARDLAASLGLSLSIPKAPTALKGTEARVEDLIKIENQDFERCPHYGAGLALEVRVMPSPLWLQVRLARLGIRPISNVVDITNYLLLEFGQPLHAFDLDRIEGGALFIRRATSGEEFRTLDGVLRTLDADDLVIADRKKALALAGVMGGADSEITNNTQQVLLECASFEPRGVRRSARRHAMHTESSHRFERGTDRGAIPLVLTRALALMAELAGASISPHTVHIESKPLEPRRVSLRHSRIEALLGTKLPFEQAVGMLGNLGFRKLSAEGSAKPEATFEVPTHRHDIAYEADLVDEVARMHGLDQIEPSLPAIIPTAPSKAGEIERRAASAALGLGLSEAVTYHFVAEKVLGALKAPSPTVRLLNPLSEERSVMQTSLLPGLLDAVRRAERHGERAAALYTIGPLFLPASTALEADARKARPNEDRGRLPEERLTFAAVLAGQRPEYLTLKPAEYDVFDIKAVATRVVEEVTGNTPTVVNRAIAHLHPRASGELSINGLVVGNFGTLHPDVAEELELSSKVQVVELDLGLLEGLGSQSPRYRLIPKLPAVIRDLSLVVNRSVSSLDLERAIRDAGGELCESVELVTLFEGGSVPEGQRSLTYRLIFRDPLATRDPERARTLTDQEVDKARERVAEVAGQRFGATLRS